MAFLGFVLFLVPILGVGAVGIKRLVEENGIRATVMLGLSIPFYLVSVKAMLESLQISLQKVSLGDETSFLSSFSHFDWFSIGMLLLLLVLFRVFSTTFRKNVAAKKNQE